MQQDRVRRSWWLDGVLVAAFVALTMALARGHLLSLDQGAYDWVLAHRPRPLYWAARVFNYLGQGGQVLMPVAIVLAAVLTWRRRSVRPLLVPAAAFVLTYLTIGPLKIWLRRAAPAFDGPHATMLFNPAAHGSAAVSYPSGHLGNSLVWYAAIAILLGALTTLSRTQDRLLRLLPPTIVLVTTVYTGFHWCTDSLAGILLGVVLARTLQRIPYDRIPLPHLHGWGAVDARPELR